MSSQGAISSLVFSSSAVGTASSMGYVFGRPTKPKKQIKLSHIPAMMDISSDENSLSTSPTSTTSTSSSYSMYSSIVTNISSSLTNVSSKSFSKSPLKKFKLFGSSGKRSKLYNSTYILPPKTIHPHVVHPDQLVDDDFSSIYSADVADNSVYNNSSDRVRKTLSVPNLPVTIKQWDNSPSMSITSGGGFVPNNVPEIPEEEEEDWDIGFNEPFNEPLSKPARKSLTALPLSNPNPSPKRHNRCKSLPPINVQDFSPSLYHRQPTPSEIWDEDFELGTTNELNVPSSVEESQVSLRMDISNIRDFVSHIGKLKDLRDEKDNLVTTIKSKTTRKYGFIRTKPKKFKDLENLFQEFKQDWLETNVIIDIADIAQDNEAKFKGGKRVEVDIDNIPSKRHMEIFEEIFSESLSENDDEFFENDKENQYDNDFNIPSKKQKLMSFCTKDDDLLRKEKRRRREENFRMSVEVMPSLIERLGRLQVRLNIHIQKLVELERNTI